MPDPEWLTAAVAELNRLDDQREADKMRATVIALADARVNHRYDKTVWVRADFPDVCSRTVYNKWRDKNPVFVEVLAAVTKLALDYRDSEELRALQLSRRRLRLASPVAVGRLITLLQSADESIVIRAALGILDRAGDETAAKSSSVVTGDVTVRSAAELTDDDLASIATSGGL